MYTVKVYPKQGMHWKLVQPDADDRHASRGRAMILDRSVLCKVMVECRPPACSLTELLKTGLKHCLRQQAK